MIGSGASGLAAAVSAERAGRPRRARDEGLAAGEQLLEGAGRHPGALRRRRLARAARRRRLALVARDRRPAARRGADRRRASPRSTGSRSSASSSRATNGGYRLARCGGASAQAPAPGRRPHRPRDHEAAARGVGGGRAARASRTRRSASSRSRTAAGAPSSATTTIDAGTVVLAAGGRCYARGRGARRALDEPSERDRRGDADRARPRRRGARPRRAAVPPERRRVAAEHAGLLDPRDDARLRRRAAERRRRGVHRLARPARRRQPGDLRRGRRRARASTTPDGRPAVYLDTTRIPARRRRGVAAVHAPPLPRRGHRPAAREDPHLPGAPLPERRARDRHRRRDDARRCLRLRRDRRRHARAQPDDGQLAARVRRLRKRAGRPQPRTRAA